MKKMRIENGMLIAYIQQQDVRTLISIKDFVRGEIFREESILKGECNEEGYYRIANLSNVHYIRSLDFIPNYDYLLKLDFKQLDELATKAIADFKAVNEILIKLCDAKQPLTEQERQILSSTGALDKALVEQIEANALECDNLRDIKFRSMAQCLSTQMKSYMYSVTAVADMRKPMEQEQIQPEETEKQFSLKRVIGKFTGKKPQ